MCMWLLCSRLLAVDPPFEREFLSNPVSVARRCGATRDQARAFGAMNRADLEQFIGQIESVRRAFGPELQKRIAADVGVQIVVARAMMDAEFSKRLQRDSEAAVTEMLGRTRSAKGTLNVVTSKEFAQMNGFADQRLALKKTGRRFTRALTAGGATSNRTPTARRSNKGV